MTIRALYGVLIGMFALLSAVAGLWQLTDSGNKLQAAEWIRKTNLIASVAQQASAILAMERGITAAILANPDAARAPMRDEMARIRGLVDNQHHQIIEHIRQFTRSAPGHPIAQALAQIDSGRRSLGQLRTAVDAGLAGDAPALPVQHWIEQLSGRIEALQVLTSLGVEPLPQNIYTYTSLPVIKDILFTLSEALGKERAALAVLIARGQPFSAADLRQLDDIRAVIGQTSRRLRASLAFEAGGATVDAARARVAHDLYERYERLRHAVVESGRLNQPHPVSADEWFREATHGIDAVLALSSAINAEFERDIDAVQLHANESLLVLGLTLGATLVLFFVTLLAIQRRVLKPLRTLEQAAQTVSRGDLTQALRLQGDDEFGQLGSTFEHMRRSLLADVERREADAAALRKYKALIENSASWIVIATADGTIEYVNVQFCAVTGYSRQEAVGSKVGFWRSGLTPRQGYVDMWKVLRAGHVWEGELLNRRKNGELFWASVIISPVLDGEGRISHLICTAHDISEHREIAEQLSFLSTHDELTGLPNRSLLARRFQEAVAAPAADAAPIGLVMIGISGFKRINHSLGRDAGDQLIKEIGRRLSQSVGPQDTVCRHGGTEFSVLLTGRQDHDDIAAAVTRLVQTANLPTTIRGRRLQPTVSAGFSTLSQDGSELDVLLRKAMVALHHAERHGQSCCPYTEALDVNAQQWLALESALRRALEQRLLELHYQPKVDIATGRIVGAEALARWRDPYTGEYISPARFIPVAEESGLIQQLGAWALREACEQNRAWQQAGLPEIVIAVNVSPQQLRQPRLAESVADIIRGSRLDARWVELELTESALMERPDEANRILGELKSLGLSLSVDDFGTGYSSLAYLNVFPLDQLKIDRSFVKAVTTDPKSAAISTSVIALAHRMGLTVVAEGVEHPEQLAFLAEHGCDCMQGYLFSRPLPAEQFAELLRDRTVPQPTRSTQTLVTR